MINKMIKISNQECDFCGTCVAVCPVDAIELKESIILVDNKKCTLCNCCIDICPLGIPQEGV
jgi:ferredoxin